MGFYASLYTFGNLKEFLSGTPVSVLFNAAEREQFAANRARGVLVVVCCGEGTFFGKPRCGGGEG